MINPAEIYKFKKAQSKMQKELENIFATQEKRGIKVVVRGDRKIESIEIEGEEHKDLKDMINDALKDVNKKAEKQLRGQLGDLGINIPGL